MKGKGGKGKSEVRTPYEKVQRSEGSHGWRDITFLDLFPYNPHYSFNGFRSLFGASLSILFLFAVFLRVVTQVQTFVSSDPVITNKVLGISTFDTLFPLPQIGAKIVIDGRSYSNPRVLKLYFEQATLQAGTSVRYSSLGSKSCSIADPAGVVEYTSLLCPTVTGYVFGDFSLEQFQYVRVRVEQCVNVTTWNATTFTYDVTGSTTGGDGIENSCLSESEVESTLSNAVLLVYVTETELLPDAWTKESQHIYTIQRVLPSSLFISHQIFLAITRVYFTARYVFETYNTKAGYAAIGREDEMLSDITTTVGEDNLFHINRIEVILRLDRVYTQQVRDHISIYTLFESISASFLFFIGAFGSLAWFINRHYFLEQTRGLDIRKMDKDQFDKYGRLVDKSFQMPRELQDMQAE
eukprot:c12118_g1_i1.p1 GENE.c12118_g1_i1~~c12118_g1_i1.p1  ORF type:complete len:410 (+),score=161.45 c12118_g1_i1:72-1301(+)